MSESAPDSSRTGHLALVVLAATGAAGVALSWTIAHHSLIGARWNLIALLAFWIPIWLVSARAALAVPTPLALGAVLVIAVLLRLAAVAATPSISDDLYRYAWDGHVQLAGVDPYRHAPNSPSVVRLRTPGLWPSPARCRKLRQQPGCTVLNRPDVRTIYPAVGEGWFAIVHALTPGDDGSRPWQLAGGAVDVASVVLIAIGLRATGRDPRKVAWYALSPLPVIEFAGNGHVDGLALLLLLAALLALRRDRRGLAGVLVGMATMVKIYPAVAVVAMWRRGRWRLMAAAVATAVITELPHVIFVGTRVLGYLPGYLKEEHYSTGSRFLLLSLTGLNGPAQLALGAACMGLVTIIVWRRHTAPEPALAVLLSTLILITTPVQPWYAVTVAGIGCLADQPWLALLALAGEPYYATVILDDPHQVLVGRICYGLAAIGILRAVLARDRHRRANARPMKAGTVH